MISISWANNAKTQTCPVLSPGCVSHAHLLHTQGLTIRESLLP